MSSKKGKKLILIRNDLLDEAVKITSKEGKTVYAFTNEIFEQALKAYEMQTNPAELVEFYALMKLEKDSGATIIPIDLLNYMLTEMYKTDKEELLKNGTKQVNGAENTFQSKTNQTIGCKPSKSS